MAKRILLSFNFSPEFWHFKTGDWNTKYLRFSKFYLGLLLQLRQVTVWRAFLVWFFTKNLLMQWYEFKKSLKHRFMVETYHKTSMKLSCISREAATRGVLWKKLFIKISQYSQENNCVGVSFNKVVQVCNFIKKRLQHRCFPWNIVKFFRIPILKNFCDQLLL